MSPLPRYGRFAMGWGTLGGIRTRGGGPKDLGLDFRKPRKLVVLDLPFTKNTRF